MANQLLSQKASGPGSVVRVAEAVCGINSQDFLESFGSFWARVEGFKDSDMLSELRPRGGLVRTYTVRGTMHTIAAKDYWIHITGGPLRRFEPWFDKIAKKRGIPGGDFRMRMLYEPFLDHIKGRAVSSNELKDYMVRRLTELGLKAKMKLNRGWSGVASFGPAWTGLSEMAYRGLLVNAGRKGSASVWMSTADWLGTKRKSLDSAQCAIELVRKYINCYGPVTLEDVAYWTFLLKRDVLMALDVLKKDLVTETFEPSSSVAYYSIPRDHVEARVPEVVILPEFDSLLMGYKDKSRVLSSDHLKQVFSGFGGISRTVLIDGFVAATWKMKKVRSETVVSVRPLRSFGEKEARSIREEFQKFADYRNIEANVVFES
jgi:Winged helix DNA-binding domain